MLAAQPADVGALAHAARARQQAREQAALLAFLVQESPYTEELIDRLMADTIRKIRERSNKERGKTLTRKIKEAERTGNGELVDRLTLDVERLRKEKGSFS